MSKTEILQLRAHTMLTFMAEDIKPFILAALLENAGAKKRKTREDRFRGQWVVDVTGLGGHNFYVFPVPKEAE